MNAVYIFSSEETVSRVFINCLLGFGSVLGAISNLFFVEEIWVSASLKIG